MYNTVKYSIQECHSDTFPNFKPIKTAFLT